LAFKKILVFLAIAIVISGFVVAPNVAFAAENGTLTIKGYLNSYISQPNINALECYLDQAVRAVWIRSDSQNELTKKVTIFSSREELVSSFRVRHFEGGFNNGAILQCQITPLEQKNTYSVFVKSLQHYSHGVYEISDNQHYVLSEDGSRILQVVHDYKVGKL
jgi:hypothetical protein